MAQDLTPALAEMLARVALGHVTRAYPHKLDHVLSEPGENTAPEALHPLFFGSFDWHSCVHGYWTLAHLLGRFPDMAAAPDIRTLFERHFTAERVAGELAYFARPSARGFERPYGWAWLLKLAAELESLQGASATALRPLATLVADRFRAFLPLAIYPVRVGTHGNTAFALLLAADYAEVRDDQALLSLLRDKVATWYGSDRDCQAWEPGGDDFLSSALVEAACMRRLLPHEAFLSWFDAFLPRLAEGEPATLFHPAVATDRSDGKLAHLDGLNLSRAWCWRLLAGSLDEGDSRRDRALAAAAAHLARGLPHVADHYMGEHWLASFALLALDC